MTIALFFNVLVCIVYLIIGISSYQLNSPYTKIRKDIINRTSKMIILQNLFNLAKASAQTMNNDDIVVVGSNGKTGKIIVQKLKEKKIPVRAASRRLDNNNEQCFIDVTKIDTIENAIKNSKAVIFAASASNSGGNTNDVDYVGLQNVASEVLRLKVPRLIVISVAALNRPNSTVFAATDFIGNIRPWKKNIMEYKLKGEEAVIDAYKLSNDKSLSYTIIRPGILFDSKGVGAIGIELNQGDTISGEINREDVADCAIAVAISKTVANNVIFEIYQTEGIALVFLLLLLSSSLL